MAALVGAALCTAATFAACSVGDLDVRGKACGDTCPGGMPCIDGICGGASEGGTLDGSVGADGQGGDAGPADGAPDVDPGPVPDCPPGSCVAPPPAGWTGPFQIYDGNPANVPACPARSPVVALAANADMNAPPAAQCSACSCGGATAATCGKALIGPGCTACPTQTAPALYGCYYPGTVITCGGSAATDALITPAAADGGSCPPDGGVATRPPVTWQRAQIACMNGNVSTSGCDGGRRCVPTPASPFESALCVMQDGDVGCPGAPYSSKRVVQKGTADTRGCSACTCGPATGIACPTTVTPYGDTNCMSATGAPIAAPTCQSLSPALFISVGAPIGGSCTPSGVAPAGTVTPSMPVTVCCTP